MVLRVSHDVPLRGRGVDGGQQILVAQSHLERLAIQGSFEGAVISPVADRYFRLSSHAPCMSSTTVSNIRLFVSSRSAARVT
jgi:hypothetical protein